MTRRTTSQQLQFLRDKLAAELDRENPDIDTINHIQRDIQRMKKRINTKNKTNAKDKI